MTRRFLVLSSFGLTALARAAFAAAKEKFWDAKPADNWSDQEIQELLFRSPWAKQTTADVNMEDRGYNPGAGGGGRGGMSGGSPAGGMSGGSPSGGAPGGATSDDPMAGMSGGGGGGGRRGGGSGGGDTGGGVSSIKTTVRWESSQAVADAEKRQLPPDAAKYYIILVAGLNPMGGRSNGRMGRSDAAGDDSERRARMADALKKQSSLQFKGHDPISAERVDTAQDRPVMAFLFPREGAAPTIDDKEVVFAAKVGPAAIKVKFPLKDMIYKGHLDL